jgi:pSer/pThr/pTyr-binding forkhead associated (FHA) protein
LGNCKICNRQVLENGQCLYCTTSEALNLRSLVPDHLLEPPADENFLKIIEVETGREFPLDQARVRIGRDPRNQVVIDDLYVSRNHAFITFEDGKFWVEDLGSKNGTKLNGAHIVDREVLNSGDLLTVGHAEFRVE